MKMLGNDVDVAHDGAAALEQARANRPEIVLLDIGLPGMSGFDVAARFRSDPAFRKIRLIAVSGYGSAGDYRRAQAAGFDAQLMKPLDIDALRDVLSAAR